MLLLLKVLAVDQLHLLLLLQSQLLILLLLQVVLLLLLLGLLLSLLLLLLQVETVQVIGLIGTRKDWETSRIHTDYRLGLVVARFRARVPQMFRSSVPNFAASGCCPTLTRVCLSLTHTHFRSRRFFSFSSTFFSLTGSPLTFDYD